MTATTHIRVAEEALIERDGHGIGLRERAVVGAFAAARTALGSPAADDSLARLSTSGIVVASAKHG